MGAGWPGSSGMVPPFETWLNNCLDGLRAKHKARLLAVARAHPLAAPLTRQRDAGTIVIHSPVRCLHGLTSSPASSMARQRTADGSCGHFTLGACQPGPSVGLLIRGRAGRTAPHLRPRLTAAANAGLPARGRRRLSVPSLPAHVPKAITELRIFRRRL